RVDASSGQEVTLHGLDVAASVRNACEVVVGDSWARIAELERAADMMLRFVELPVAVVGGAEVEVRSVVVAERGEDLAALGHSFAKEVAQARVFSKPVLHE